MTSRTPYPVLSSSMFGIIAVTPFLVLVILEFVITPMSCGTYPRIRLPLANYASGTLPNRHDFVISIQKTGTILIVNRFHSLPEFRLKMRELFTKATGKRVIVEADRRLSFREIRPVLSAIGEAGFTGVTLATAEADPLVGVGVLFGATVPQDPPE